MKGKEFFAALIVLIAMIVTCLVPIVTAGFQSSVVIELNVIAGEWNDSASVEEQPMQVEPFEYIASGSHIAIGPARDDQNFNNQNNPVVFSDSGNEKCAQVGSGKNDR